MPTALVTGASRGLGAAFATRLSRDGYDLVLVDRDEVALSQFATSVRGSGRGREVEAVVADLAAEAGLRTVADRLADPDRPVDLLVNNAGVQAPGEFTEVDVTGLQAEVDVNITAVMRLTRAALPGMTARGRGAVVNVASFAGFLAGRGDAYAATKAWVLAFTDTVAASLAGTGVRMMALCVGQLRTRMFPAPEGPSRSGLAPEEVVDACLTDLARGRTLSVPGWRYRAVVDALELPKRALRTAAKLAGKGRTHTATPTSGGASRSPMV